MFALALAQFLLVTGDQVHAEINRQSDQHGHKRDGQDVQVPDHQRGEGHRVCQAHDQTDRRLNWSARFVVAVDEDQRDERQ